MLLGKALCILAFNVVSFNRGVYGLDWPWNWVGVTGVGTTGKMVLASTVSPMCAAVCGSSEERQDLKCHTRKIDGTKGLDEYLILANPVESVKKCEEQCNDQPNCRAFRYLPKNYLCFLYKSQKYIEDDDSESQFYIKGCILCYMNVIEKETQKVWEVSTFKECENHCIKSDDCSAVHFDGKRCFKFTNKVEPNEKTGFAFSTKICIDFNDNASEYHDNRYKQNGKN
ncbi:uncharacterized protein LOC127720019 [Mytilus californianus]|uniref:uncharacterized protein LOC127720019 n=1 Tax=Mytilus californianus TaxID=6549 RepID=UPI0022453A48|nr:uncharacterized protein LOC127720019 [Mytilus californianus]